MEQPSGESHPEIDSFLDRLENLAGWKFSHRGDIALLLGLARGREALLNEAAFYAKFLTKSYALLKRTRGEDVSRLEAEFAEKMEKTLALLRSLVEGSPGEAGRAFAVRYLTPSAEGLENLLSLLAELSWLKNYEIESRRSRT
ncbi:MAG TPA: hypothetical protein VI215_09785 [Bacteroidota bacterium]|jgi:hypothetical protein